MKKKTSLNAISLLFTTLLLMSALALSPARPVGAQATSMTFTSGDTINFESVNNVTIRSTVQMTFSSGIYMGFGTGVQIVFSAPSGLIQACDIYTLILGNLPVPCTWWELLDQTTGKPTGFEFHIDATNPPMNQFHIGTVIPGPAQVNPAQPVVAELKIDSLEYCDQFVVHWNAGYVPPECSWWEIIEPGQLYGYEFHVDISNPTEFHIDQVIPGPIMIPSPGFYEIVALQKIPDVSPCDYFVIEDPRGWYPPTCTWWEILDPYGSLPTGFEFHVDWTNESCEFHVDGMMPGPFVLPVPGVPYITAVQKILNITGCDWFDVVTGGVPVPCTWWEILDPNGLPTGLEFHVDDTAGTYFHVDQLLPHSPIMLPWGPSYTVTIRQKVDTVQPCAWFTVPDGALTPKPCTWWRIVIPNVGDVEFHVDESYSNGTFHIDEVYPQSPIILNPPVYEVVAEAKISTLNPCDWYEVVDPQGFLPAFDTYWNITSPGQWAGITFHVDSNDGISQFHIDYVDSMPPGPIPPPWSVTAEEYTPTPAWYWKPSYEDYVPSGMPDFDDRQWLTYLWQDSFGAWSHCGPVSVANSLWWLDSQFEPNPVSPPIVHDDFPLVKTYGQWDDHDPQNTPWLIEHLAWLMDTDGRRTTLVHSGTNVNDMQAGITQYLSWSGVNPLGDVNGDGIVDQTDIAIVAAAMGTHPGDPTWNLAADIFPATITYPPLTDNFIDQADADLVTSHLGLTGLFYEHTVAQPGFDFIEREVEKCQDVVLLLGYWIWNDGAQQWYREGGHYVTVAGVNSQESKLAISDPMEDAFERSLIPEGRVPIPHMHMPPEPPYITHNNAAFVSQDIYAVLPFSPPFPPCPGGNLTLMNYVNWGPTPPYFTVIEYAVVTSQLADPDIAVTNVTTGKSGCRPYPTLCKNFTTWVNVTVANQGPFNETVTVTAYANATVIGIQTINNMMAGATEVLKFLWSSSTFAYGNYSISASVAPVAAELDLIDNALDDGIVGVTLPGDATGDWKVGPPDFAYLSAAYGATPSSPKWNPNPDFDCNDKIGPSDFAYLSAFYGQHYP